ncbi:transposase [Pinisolibacter sp. B13]|nr:transposase [Pinisolibacter aquiterrae]
MDEARDDMLAYMAFPREHWARIASTDPIERLNGELKRRSDVVGLFPKCQGRRPLGGALMLEQNDERAVCRRYMTREGLKPVSDDPLIKLPAVAA